MTKKVYTPEGVQDILFEECYIKKEIEDKTRKLLISQGYREIETPSIEYYDLYSSRQKNLSQEVMYKFCDKEGRILTLRPELTIPAVRAAITKIKKPRPMKLFYIGNSFRYNDAGGGRMNEYTQAGIEIIGAVSPEADAEVIATAIKFLIEAGLENFQIDIGQVGFFKGLAEEANLSSEETEELRALIDNKNHLGIEKLINNKKLPEDLKELILSMPALFGSKDIIDKVEKMDINDTSRKALQNLRHIMDILNDYGYLDHISVDLGMLPGLDYYTGLIFRGFTYDIGYPILSGGRYDDLVGTFSEAEPATGFSLGINMLITAMRRQELALSQPLIDYFIAYKESCRAIALLKADELRKSGKTVMIDVNKFTPDEAKIYAEANDFSKLMYIADDGKISYISLTVV